MGFIKSALGWFFGVIFGLAGFGFFAAKSFSPISAVAMWAMAAMLIPPIFNKINAALQNKVSGGAKAGIIFALFVFAGLAAPKDQNRSISSTEQQAQTPNVQPEKVETPKLKESCLAVSGLFGTQSNLSNVQMDAIFKDKYAGKKFNWTMEVVEVHEGTFGGYTVQYKCQNSHSLILDVSVEYPSSAKNLVMQLQKGSYYKVSGNLKTYSKFLGLIADAE